MKSKVNHLSGEIAFEIVDVLLEYNHKNLLSLLLRDDVDTEMAVKMTVNIAAVIMLGRALSCSEQQTIQSHFAILNDQLSAVKTSRARL